MTLEEAIIHCKEKACDNTQCALEHKQLAEWLQELQQYRKNIRKKEKQLLYKPKQWALYVIMNLFLHIHRKIQLKQHFIENVKK